MRFQPLKPSLPPSCIQLRRRRLVTLKNIDFMSSVVHVIRLSAGPCPEGWVFRGEQCFQLNSEEKTWSESYVSCREQNADMLEIRGYLQQETAEGKLKL